MILNSNFFIREDVCQIARELIGKTLVTNFNGGLTSGTICETEAYCGTTDRACHAFKNKKTPRTEVFFEEGGISYVYLCYGIHRLFNIITGPKNCPRAVLIRAVIPKKGVATMEARRKTSNNLANGPGKLSQALGIELEHNYKKLVRTNHIWIEDQSTKLEYISSPRIGIDYAGEDAKLPWRFVATEK